MSTKKSDELQDALMNEILGESQNDSTQHEPLVAGSDVTAPGQLVYETTKVKLKKTGTAAQPTDLPPPPMALPNEKLVISEASRTAITSKPASPVKSDTGIIGTSLTSVPTSFAKMPIEDKNNVDLDATIPVVEPRMNRQIGMLNPELGARVTNPHLAHSENMRLAQQKILSLEDEIERLRRESEQLIAAGEILRRKTESMTSDLDKKDADFSSAQEKWVSEKEILQAQTKAREKEVRELRTKVEEYEMRLSSNIQKIRVRERELENRLELVKLENTALARNKDEIILELKRQIDQMTYELDNSRSKGQDLNRQIQEKQDTLRRTVKALRLALSMLEGQTDESDQVKKAK
jgi:hypothetical protein